MEESLIQMAYEWNTLAALPCSHWCTTPQKGSTRFSMSDQCRTSTHVLVLGEGAAWLAAWIGSCI